ncbi:polysaccharide/polyol phosphate ABC transporter ATP-binding protein [Oscillatoriales cyanobacterium USR001]|nr:polysaccharide/polyol phosphate ABC transporter ATP-binding protein [Oscillatoriales cyanobacterium USR001]
MQEAIIVQGLGKQFSRYSNTRPYTIMEAVLSAGKGMKAQERFWALQDISFSLYPGKMLGIVGRNGAGKSTMLQLLGGITIPDHGKIQVNGKIGGLLDLGAGFHSDLTGRENVFVGGVVAGLTNREIRRRFDSIVEFAELKNFIDSPLRTYSTGMKMRLGFSVAVHTDPDVLLVDEFLAVGDLSFQNKCLARISQFKSEGCAIVLISHNAQQIQKLCDETMWLRSGKIVAYGESEVVVGQYLADMQSDAKQDTPMRPSQFTTSGVELRVNENRFGSLEVEITDVRLLPQSEINCGDGLSVEISYRSSPSISVVIFGINITREDGQKCFETNTSQRGRSLLLTESVGTIKLHIDRLDLGEGKYFVNVGVYEKNWAYSYDYHWHVYPLNMRSPIHDKTLLSPPYSWDFSGKIQVTETEKISAKVLEKIDKDRDIPNFLIIGAQFCGTSQLFNCLVERLKTSRDGTQEIHYFDLNFNQGIDWYKQQFMWLESENQRVIGETTPYYIFHPLVPKRVFQQFPKMKIIAILGNPVHRAWMHYQHEVSLGIESLNFERAIAAEPQRLQGEVEKMIADENYYSFNHQNYAYLGRGIYVEQLKNWLEYFPKEQLLVLKSEDFYENTPQNFAQVLEFLEISAGRVKEFTKYAVNNYNDLPEKMRKKLEEYFKPHNQQLSKYLHRDFNWD